LESVRREHEQALAAAPDVLHELRACGYYNLVLWDLMLETKD